MVLVCYSIGAGTGLGHPHTFSTVSLTDRAKSVRVSQPVANDERNKEYSVHLVGPELKIYVIKMYGTANIKFKVSCVSRAHLIFCD
jgi:hypothetical protein